VEEWKFRQGKGHWSSATENKREDGVVNRTKEKIKWDSSKEKYVALSRTLKP